MFWEWGGSHMRILVTGAAGFIGSRFCEMAAAQGHGVVALMRPRPYARSLPAGEIVYGRLPYDVPSRAWRGVEAVVHLAGATTGQDPQESHAINCDGTAFLIDQARAHCAIKRFVFISSQSAHEDAVSAYGKTKREAEEIVRAGGLPYAIVRPGLVFGPGEHGLFSRMRGTVRRLPVLPLLGGGRAIVQGIEVSDLGKALMTCLSLDEGTGGFEFNLGDSEGMPLREFLQAIAVAETGRRKMQLVVPLWPFKLAVGCAERIGLKLPISGDNLRGMEMVRRMETAPSHQKLGLTLTPFAEAMAASVSAAKPAAGNDVATRPVRVLLVGAGKIGIVHALNLAQREGSALCGVVDRNRKAFGLYRSMGFTPEFRNDAAAAIEELRPDGVIVATPASTHLELARLCCERRVPVLVEKPMAVRPCDVQEFLALRSEFPDGICHVGYMAAQYPHLQQVRRRLAGGEFGRVLGYRAFCLQSHIMASKPVRWEMIRAQSGGGALINYAGHAVSMLLRLFGEPTRFGARMWPIYSTEVEDAVEVRMVHSGGISGRLVASWSIPGYARPVSEIVILTDQGEVHVRNYCASFQRGGHTEWLFTQRDLDIGYNAAPDYTGGGFSVEHRNFAAAIRASRGEKGLRGDSAPESLPVEIEEAARVENLIFSLYEASEGLDPRSPVWQGAPAVGDAGMQDVRMDAIIEELLA
jgi:predicted dehydrogenase/nucleoside-diphosphate-sugar epimerase